MRTLRLRLVPLPLAIISYLPMRPICGLASMIGCRKLGRQSGPMLGATADALASDGTIPLWHLQLSIRHRVLAKALRVDG